MCKSSIYWDLLLTLWGLTVGPFTLRLIFHYHLSLPPTLVRLLSTHINITSLCPQIDHILQNRLKVYSRLGRIWQVFSGRILKIQYIQLSEMRKYHIPIFTMYYIFFYNQVSWVSKSAFVWAKYQCGLDKCP